MFYIVLCIYRKAHDTNVHPIPLQSTLVYLTLHTNHCYTHFSLGKACDVYTCTKTYAFSFCSQAQTGALNQSVSLSPFNVSLLLLASSPTSSDVGSSQGIDTRDKFTNDSSLGMLSTVAMYHSGLSEGGGEGEQREKERGSDQREGVSSVPAAVGDRMAQMRLESSSGKTLSPSLHLSCYCRLPCSCSSLSRHSRHYIECR